LSDHPHAAELTLEPDDNARLANLCGPIDEHLRLLERRLGVEINNRGNRFRILGEDDAVIAATRVIERLYDATGQEQLNQARVHLYLQQSGVDELVDSESTPAGAETEHEIRTRHLRIRARGPNQKRYLHSILEYDINFGIRRSRRVSDSVSCPAIWRRRSTLTCAHSTMPSTKCSVSNRWPS